MRIKKNSEICHSAQPGIDVPGVLKEVVDKEIYRADYESVTSRILKEQISYDKAIEKNVAYLLGDNKNKNESKLLITFEILCKKC